MIWNTIQNIFRIEELRQRIYFTLAILFVFRLGAHIPTPGIDGVALTAFFEAQQGSILRFFDMFTGGALARLTVFALGVMPYISASIIMQLLTVVFPYLERLSKEGEAGRKKITIYTRYGTIVLSLVQAFGISAGFGEYGCSGWISRCYFDHEHLGFPWFDSDYPNSRDGIPDVGRGADQ